MFVTHLGDEAALNKLRDRIRIRFRSKAELRALAEERAVLQRRAKLKLELEARREINHIIRRRQRAIGLCQTPKGLPLGRPRRAGGEKRSRGQKN